MTVRYSTTFSDTVTLRCAKQTTSVPKVQGTSFVFTIMYVLKRITHMRQWKFFILVSTLRSTAIDIIINVCVYNISWWKLGQTALRTMQNTEMRQKQVTSWLFFFFKVQYCAKARDHPSFIYFMVKNGH